jgi:acetyl-CoA carboxylase carboxyl transferase subunit beta
LAVYLANPTTGGVFASWSSLAHVTFAEPGATIGFTGPRVAATLGEPIVPADSQTAEGLLANGLVDAIVPVDDLRARFAAVLAAVAPVSGSAVVLDETGPVELDEGPTGWDAVVASRVPGRHRVLDDVLAGASVVVELAGDRSGSTGPAVFAGICRLDGGPVMVLAHRVPTSRPTAADLRVAQRAMIVADELRIPVVTIIDTPGATISGEQERQGLAGEIARSIDTLSSLTVPTLAVIAGQGSGGAAMAWLAADRVVAAADSWLAPIAPEAASAIVHRDTDHADEMADDQAISAIELRKQGIVDSVYETGQIAQLCRRLAVSGPR